MDRVRKPEREAKTTAENKDVKTRKEKVTVRTSPRHGNATGSSRSFKHAADVGNDTDSDGSQAVESSGADSDDEAGLGGPLAVQKAMYHNAVKALKHREWFEDFARRYGVPQPGSGPAIEDGLRDRQNSQETGLPPATKTKSRKGK